VTPEQEIRRGENASAVLRSDVYQEAWAMIRDRIVSQLEMADTSDEQRRRLNDLLIAHRKARQYIEQVMVSGKMANQQMEKVTLMERAKRAIR